MNRLFRPTLVQRVVLALLLGFFLIWAAIVSFGFIQVNIQARQDDRDFGSTPIGLNLRAAFSAVEEPDQVRAIAAALDRMRHQNGPLRIVLQIIDREDNRMVYSSSDIDGAMLHGDAHHKTIVRIAGRAYDVFEADTPRWTVLWARSRFPMISFWILKTATAQLLPNLALALPCVLIPVWLAVSFGLRPLKRFSESIQARGPEDLAPTGMDPKHAELRPLRTALDELLARLRRRRESEEAFVANAAHELRTPLAVIAAQAHVLASSTTDADRTDAQRQMEASLERASHLIHQLLSLTRLEMERQERSTVDLAQLARRELAQFVPAAIKRNIEISFDAPDRLVLTLEAHLFRSILQNLVDNAVRYGRAGGKIASELRLAQDTLTLSISDDGPGIEHNDRERVFDRFQRGAGVDTPGTGLGLAIVKQATARMGGDVSIANGLDGRGCRFTVHLPIWTAPNAGISIPGAVANNQRLAGIWGTDGDVSQDRSQRRSSWALCRDDGHSGGAARPSAQQDAPSALRRLLR